MSSRFDQAQEVHSPIDHISRFNNQSRELVPSKNFSFIGMESVKNVKRKVQGVPQSQTAALPRHQEEEETDRTKQAQTYEKH